MAQAYIEKNKWTQYAAWAGVVLLIVVGKLYTPTQTSTPVPPILPEFKQVAVERPVAFPVALERVIDGDTIVANGVTFRLAGIDAPESKQDYGQEAKAFLEALLSEGAISVQIEGTDKWGRALAHVFIDGISVSEILLENGFAHVFYTDNKKQNNLYRELEQSAKAKRIGLWANPDATIPYQFRQEQAE